MDSIKELLHDDVISAIVVNLMIAIIAVLLAKALQIAIVKLLSHGNRYMRWQFGTDCGHHVKRPLFILLICITLSMSLPWIRMQPHWLPLLLRVIGTAAFGWFMIQIVRDSGEWLTKLYAEKEGRDPVGRKRFNTQIKVLMRVSIVIVGLLTVIGIAFAIPGMRQLGMSLFASAGVAGIVIGIAANSALSNLIAGIQLALSQQILLDDEVVVDNQSGVIEEITSSYVVMRSWDLRRLIIPLRHFMEKPFENWTYQESDMMGTVMLYTDHEIDIDAIRKVASEAVKKSKFWDGKRNDLLVTDIRDDSLELRITLSATTSSKLWNLRCEVREKLVAYLQKHDAFPKRHIHLQRQEDDLSSRQSTGKHTKRRPRKA